MKNFFKIFFLINIFCFWGISTVDAEEVTVNKLSYNDEYLDGLYDFSIVEFNNLGLFSAKLEYQDQEELFIVSDDNQIKPAFVKDESLSYQAMYPETGFEFNKKFYMFGFDEKHGVELWSLNSDGMLDFVKDLNPGKGSGISRDYKVNHIEFGGNIYFEAIVDDFRVLQDNGYYSDQYYKKALWELNSQGDIRQVSDISYTFVIHDVIRYHMSLEVFNDKLYFPGTREGFEGVWAYDGDHGIVFIGPVKMEDWRGGIKFFSFGENLFVSANRSYIIDLYDDFKEVDFKLGWPQSSIPGLSYCNLDNYYLYLSASNNADEQDYELYRIDNQAQITLESNLRSIPFESYDNFAASMPGSFTLFNGECYFIAVGDDDRTLFKIDQKGFLKPVIQLRSDRYPPMQGDIVNYRDEKLFIKGASNGPYNYYLDGLGIHLLTDDALAPSVRKRPGENPLGYMYDELFYISNSNQNELWRLSGHEFFKSWTTSEDGWIMRIDSFNDTVFITVRNDEDTSDLISYIYSIRYEDFRDLKGGVLDSYIIKLKEAGIVNGYSDGTFRPDNPITRGQMAKFVVNAFKLEVDISGEKFPDVSEDHVFFTYIQTLKNNGIVDGFSDGEYKPDLPVRRNQATKYLIEAMIYHLWSELSGSEDRGLPDFTDDYVPGDFSSYISQITQINVEYGGKEEFIMKGYSDGTFRPEEDITRAQMAKVVWLSRIYVGM